MKYSGTGKKPESKWKKQTLAYSIGKKPVYSSQNKIVKKSLMLF